MFFLVKLDRLKLSAISALLVIAVCLWVVTGNVRSNNSVEPVRVCVIMYHGLVKDNSLQNKYMISPGLFQQDLEYLKEKGCHTIFLSELISHFRDGTELPEKPVIITFDDGYYNNYTYAYPLLKKYQSKAVISPIGAESDKAPSEEYRSPAYSQCTWQELREMYESGYVELQNHTYDLHKITGERRGAAKSSSESKEEYKAMLVSDLEKANKRMKEETGTTPQCIVYPFGASGEETLDIVKDMGFMAALDCEEKPNVLYDDDDLYHIHRYLRPEDMSSGDFFGEKLKEAFSE